MTGAGGKELRVGTATLVGQVHRGDMTGASASRSLCMVVS